MFPRLPGFFGPGLSRPPAPEEEKSEAAETRHRHHHSHEVGLGGGLGLPLGLGLGALGLIGINIFIVAKYFIIVCCYSAQEFLWPRPPAQLQRLR